MTAISERQRARFYIYKKKKLRNILYTKSQTLFKNQDSFRYILDTKIKRIYVMQFFTLNFEVGIYIQKA